MPNSYLPRTTDRRPGRDSDNGDESGEPGREAAATGVGSGDVGRERDADAGGDGDGRSRDGSGVVAEAGSPAAETARSSPPRRLADDDSHAIIHIPVSVGRLVNMSVFILPAGTAIPLHDHPGMTVVTKVLWGTLHVKSYDLVRPRGSAGRLLLPGGGGARGAPGGLDDAIANGWHSGVNGGGADAASPAAAAAAGAGAAGGASPGGGTSPAGAVAVGDSASPPSAPVSVPPAGWPPHRSVPLPPGLAIAHPPQALVGGDIRTLGPAVGGNVHHFRASSAGRCALLDVSLPPYDFPGGRGVHYYAPAAPLDAGTAAALAASGVVPPPGVTFVTLTEVPSPPSYRTRDAEYRGPVVNVL